MEDGLSTRENISMVDITRESSKSDYEIPKVSRIPFLLENFNVCSLLDCSLKCEIIKTKQQESTLLYIQLDLPTIDS